MAAPRNTFTLNVDTNSLSAAINIEKTVERMEGVEKVEANPQQRRVVITGTVRPDKVIATLHNNLGIKAELSPPTSIRPPPLVSTFTLKVGTNGLFAAINIEKTVERMEGVEKVEANPQQRRVVITGTVRPDEVIATLHNNLGIKAELSPPTSIRPPPPASTFTLKVGTNSLFAAFSIQKTVEKMEGVEKVEANPQQQRVVITGTVRPDKVIATLHNNLGIKAELLPPTSIRPPSPASTFTLKVGTNSLFAAFNIEKTVEKMEGVEKVEANPQQQRVVITGTVRPDKVIATLHNNLGIKAELSPPTSIRPPPPASTFTLKVGTNSLFAAFNIQKTVEKMEGVEKVEANPQQQRVVITGTVRPDKVIATLHNNLGIKAELSSAAPRSTFTLKVGTNSLAAAINIKKMVEKMEGVEKVEANLQQRRVVITGIVRPDEVITTLHNNLGIKAELLLPTSIRPPPPASTFTLKVDTNSLAVAINIKKTVEKMDGVEKVEANPQQRRVVITGTVRPDEVIATLHNNLGIRAELSPPTSIRPLPPPAVPRNGSQIVVGQSSNAVNPLLGDLNKVAQDVGQLRRMVPGLAGVKISNQIVSNSIEFRFNSN